MFSWLKYIPLLLKFKDVADTYRKETGENKPWYLSRTFLGSAIAFIFTCLAVIFGITVDNETITVVVNQISTLIPAIIALYGIVMTIVGQITKSRRKSPQELARGDIKTKENE